MRFVSARTLRNEPGAVKTIAAEEDVVLTTNGKPFAIVIGVDEHDFQETADAVRRARALIAVSRMRRDAAAKGAARLPASQVTREVRRARAARKRP